MAEFMLIIRDEGVDFSKYSPTDFQSLLKKFGAWSKKLENQGRLLGGKKLKEDGGKSLRVRGDKIIVDGPYADTKEAIAGFYMIKANNLDEAVEIGRDCPCMTYGGSLEIREVDHV